MPFTSQNARMTVSFPGTPTETQGTLDGKPMWTIEGKHPLITARAISVIHPKPLNRGQAQNAVQTALQELGKANNMAVTNPSEINGVAYGLVSTMKSADKVVVARVWAQGDMLYQLILSATPQTMANVSGREFFGSFQALRLARSWPMPHRECMSHIDRNCSGVGLLLPHLQLPAVQAVLLEGPYYAIMDGVTIGP
jgi:hypothetical protein